MLIRSLVLVLFLVPQFAFASGVRDLLNADTRDKKATFSYGNKMNFLVVGGPHDGVVTLRAFRGTREEVIRRARAWRPACAQLQHLVFGGWWVTSQRLTFNSRFEDWSIPDGMENGHWLFVFDVKPATSSVAVAGFHGMQELQIEQDTVDAYLNTGIEVTVINTKRGDRGRSTTQTTNESARAEVQVLPGGNYSAHGTNVVPAPVITSLSCNVKQNVLPETTLIVGIGSYKQPTGMIARQGAPSIALASRIARRLSSFLWRRNTQGQPSIAGVVDE